MARGSLRIYLGAAPGVGKTFAMLGEGNRRRRRGADVVVGIVETHGRPNTAAQLQDLEVVPRTVVEHRGARLEELDVDAVLARRPEVCLVDELAHTNAPGMRNERRWQDVEELLAAGIDVVTTVNVQHLESLNDVVLRITGVAQRETVPDAFVRSADQIELVDMSPEALRRRLAHGNVYPAERIDAALANYFRVGNLTALRELALLWVADRVEDSLQEYLADHGITDTWETRERVVVALTGAPSGEPLIRRAARMARSRRGDLLGVRVASADGLAAGDQGDADLTRQRRLLAELGGTYHEIVGDDPAASLVSFARAEHATQLVLGASRRSAWQELTGGSIIRKVIREAGSIDVHVIATDAAPPAPRRRHRPRSVPRRKAAAWGLLAVGAPSLLFSTLPLREELALSTEMLLFLALVLAVGALGGVLVSLAAAVVASLIVNWFFVPPYGTLSIGESENAVALAVFLAVAGTVGGLVDRSSRRGAEAWRARAEAEALARTSAALATDPDPVARLVDLLRATFDQQAVALFAEEGDGWLLVAAAGEPVPATPADATAAFPLTADVVVPADDAAARHVLGLVGPPLSGEDQRVLRTVAEQLAVGLEARRLHEVARDAAVLADVDAVRTSILQAVSHDLRTPLASIKAYVSGLRQPDVVWADEDRAEALAAVEEECDRLNALVGNLLDASRLQAGAMAVMPQVAAVHDIAAAAVGGVPAHRVEVAVAEDLPPVFVDPVLLERALANLVANAVRHQPDDRPVRVDADAVHGEMVVRVVDNGPGIRPDARDAARRPFQRLGDAPEGMGIGLGLAITDGFVQAVGGRLSLDDTPGGGLTATVTLPLPATAPTRSADPTSEVGR